MAIIVKRLGPEDSALVQSAAVGVFDHAPQEWLTAVCLSDSRRHLVAAIEDGQVIGSASAVHYIHPDKPAELWINEVGVAPGHQRRGVGRQVLEAMLAHGRQRLLQCLGPHGSGQHCRNASLCQGGWSR